jgi:TRAP-type C4-dicarboxylate transport system permease small subunit
MGSAFFSTLGRWFLKLTSVLNAIGTVWIFFIMFVMTGDVLGRVLFNHPITGTPEIVKISIVGIVFLEMPHTLWKNRHIRSEILLQKLSPIPRSWIESFVFLLGAAVFVCIFVASWSGAIESWNILEYEGEGALRVPVYPIKTLILLGSVLTAIIFFARSVQSIKGIFKNRPEGAS